MSCERSCVLTREGGALLPWVVCLSASLFFFYEFIQGNMFASIADNIMNDFHIRVEKMAYLSSIYYVSNVLFLFVAGQLLDRYSTKKILLIAMLLCVGSTFVLAQAESYYVALFCRFITGIGSAFCLLGPVQIASRWFPPRRMAMVTGVIVTIAMLGGMVAQYPMTLLVVHMGWRSAVWMVAWVGLFMWFMMWMGIVDKAENETHHAPITQYAFIEILKRAYMNTHTLRAGLVTSLMNMAIAIFGAMMGTLYLIQRLDVSKEVASSVNGMLFLGALLGGPLIGAISDRIGERLRPMRVGVIASLVVLLAILYLPTSLFMMYVLFFALGFFTSAQVISYAYVAESSPHAITATAVSVVSVCTQAGYVVYQNLFSHLLVWHGQVESGVNATAYALSDYQFAAAMLPLGLVLALLLLTRLKETYCRHVDY